MAKKQTQVLKVAGGESFSPQARVVSFYFSSPSLLCSTHVVVVVVVHSYQTTCMASGMPLLDSLCLPPLDTLGVVPKDPSLSHTHPHACTRPPLQIYR